MAVTRAIIFSMNRAMQLDAMLRSLYFHCVDAESMEILRFIPYHGRYLHSSIRGVD